MLSVRIAVTLSAIVFMLLIPVMEINATHLFNPDWPAHARLHEAWQLMTNAALSGLALYLAWSGRAPRVAIGISLIICLSFLLAVALAGSYGGAVQVMPGGKEKQIAGVNAAVLVVSTVSAFLIFAGVRLGRNVSGKTVMIDTKHHLP